jgi:hypothetical protein
VRLIGQDAHTLTGAYALDAIDRGKELNRFNRHLNTCSSCAAEVRGFREVATSMAFAASTEAPAEMRDRVMAAVARTRQLPPEIRTHARPRRARTWVPWLSGVVATASIVVAVLFGFAQSHTQGELNQARAQNQALASEQAQITAELNQARAHDQALALILGAPHVTLLSQSTSMGGVAVVVLDAATRKLWLIGPVKIVSAGLLPTANAGVTTPVIATGIVKGDKLGLTVEPAPGSKQPTTVPILALPLPV